ncbi:MAG: hypothetical protein ACPG49_10825 [Chitinophagales bacterium]
MSNYTKIERSFKYWTRTDLEKILGLQSKKKLDVLENWLAMEKHFSLSQEEIDHLEELRTETEELIDYWNETELRENFISLLTRLVSFKDLKNNFYHFAERYLSVNVVVKPIYEVKLYGYTDWLVATGKSAPEHPFFFIHEYKPEEGKTIDGRGQLLAEMYAAQVLNKKPPMPTILNPIPKHYYKDIPLYGVYVSGRLWFFMALKDRKYSISGAYDSTNKDDLQHIIKLLKAQKQLIYEVVKKA